MTSDTEVQVQRIEFGGRYVILIQPPAEERISAAELARLSILLSRWWHSEEPFILAQFSAGTKVRFEKIRAEDA